MKVLEDNTKFITELANENEKLKIELVISGEVILNNKSLLEETNSKLYSIQDQIRNNNFEYFQLEIKRLKKLLDEKTQIIEQNLEHSQTSPSLMDDKNIQQLQTENNNLRLQLTQINTELNNLKTELQEIPNTNDNFQIQINDLSAQLDNQKIEIQNKKEIINNSKRAQTTQKMDIQAKDIISAIPIFTGDMKQFDGFINTCGVYYDIVPQDQKAFVLRIIKAKITGDALSKAGPFDDAIDTWELLKTKLKSSLRKPVSIEYAQEDLNNSFQKKDESIEEYGSKIKSKLKKLNEACRSLAKSDDELKILRKMNEKQAISKSEQNLRNETIKVLVSTANKNSLDECISFAMQKDMIEKNKNIKQCGYCGLSNHQGNSCRKKQSDNDNKQKFSQKTDNKSIGNGKNNYRSFNNDKKQYKNDNREQFQKPDNGNRFAQNKNQPQNYNKNKDTNAGESSPKNFQQRKIKTIQPDDPEDVTVEQALQMLNEPKN